MVHLTDSKHPAGTIIVASGYQPRYYEFTNSLEKLGAPAGTKLTIERSCDITRNFNLGIKSMVGEWAWFLGDDHSFDPGLLLKLLDYNVDVVVPITPTKVTPWLPCIMHGPEDTSNGKFWEEDMNIYQWSEVSGQGLFPLPYGDFIGQAGMLVRKKVLDEIGYPWFKCGQLDPGHLQEDMQFCHELQTRGYTVYVDQDSIFDHYMYMGISARRLNGQYVPALLCGGKVVVLPDAVPKAHAVTNNTDPRSGVKKVQWFTVPKTAQDVLDGTGEVVPR